MTSARRLSRGTRGGVSVASQPPLAHASSPVTDMRRGQGERQPRHSPPVEQPCHSHSLLDLTWKSSLDIDFLESTKKEEVREFTSQAN